MFKNTTNACLSRSVKLLLPLQDQEKLDILIAQEPDLWHSYDHQSSMNNFQSYVLVNESKSCRNTPHVYLPPALGQLWA
jgi:hypothetical protein